MALYISGNIQALGGVRCDLISQATGLRIESTHSAYGGGWKFNKPTPGLYDIKFYGRDVTESSWLLNYEVLPDDPYLGGEVTYTFWDGVAPYDDSKIVKENEFGWFNQSQLKFHIAGEGENPNINIEAINYRIFYNGSWTAWTPDAPGAPATTHEMDIDIATISNIAGENNIIEFYVAFEDGTQDMVTTVPFKYDDTAPTFNITAGDAVGGFGRVGLDWTNVDVSDALSGIGYIVVYRDTNDSFSGADEIARLVVVDQSIIPSSYIDNTMAQDDQATKYFYWGKAMDRAGNLSSESRLDNVALGTNIVLLLPADVDGALKIQNNPSGVNWEVVYGIHVPIQAVIITAGILSNVGAVTGIQYKADDDDTWHDVPTPKYHDQTISYPYDISGMDEGETLTFIFPTVIQDKKYFRVVFDHADAATEITLCHFESILAADIIVGGVLRLEKGLSIWTGGFDANGDPTGSGMFIDKLGLQMWDAAGTVNQRLNNDGSATFGKIGVAQITIGTNGVISIDSSLLVITSATTFETGYDPTIKRQHFSVTPTTPYWENDLWSDGVDLRRCTNTRLTGAYVAGDWEIATEYGAKSTRWIQPSTNDPSSGWSAQEKLDHEGDQWVKTDLGYKLFSWTGSAWIQDYTEIDGGHIDTYSIDADKLSIGAVAWTTNIIFEPDDSTSLGYQYLKWNSGSIKFSNGELKTTIPLGTLQLVSSPRSWVYYNEGTNTILLTATYSDAVGVGKTLMAIVDRGDVGGLCIIAPIYNTGTTIDGDKIVTGKIESHDGNTYFDLINNLIAMLGGTITGADIKTALTGDRVELDNTGIQIYDADGIGSYSSRLRLLKGVTEAYVLGLGSLSVAGSGGFGIYSLDGENLNLWGDDQLIMDAENGVHFGAETLFSINISGDLTIGTTATKIFFANKVEDYDYDNRIFTGTPNTGKYYCVQDGYYHFDLRVTIALTQSDVGWYKISIVAKGNTYTTWMRNDLTSGSYITLLLPLDVYMESGDTAECFVQRDSGTTGAVVKSGSGNTIWSGHRIR